MKFCPYCGASLMGGAVSFCTECGKALPSAAKPPVPLRKPPPRPASKRKPHKKTINGNRKMTRLSQAPGKQAPKGRPRSLDNTLAKHHELSSGSRRDPRDDGYDGYYDDIKPLDDGRIRDRSDPELIKRVILVASGAFVIVILSVILMYLL